MLLLLELNGKIMQATHAKSLLKLPRVSLIIDLEARQTYLDSKTGHLLVQRCTCRHKLASLFMHVKLLGFLLMRSLQKVHLLK